MVENEIIKGAVFSSWYGRPKSQGNPCIRPLVLDVCARYGGGRILCVKCGNRKPGNDRQDAGCAVEMECGGNGMANPIKWTLADRFRQRQPVDPSKAEENDVDLVVYTEIDDLHLQASTLVESAIQRLRPQGILMIALPVRSGWETLWSAVRNRWNHRSGGHPQFWSRQQLSALLESRSFTILESIKTRALSDRWPAIILVARKTGPSAPTGATERISTV